ncbi:FliM/FliN family flagellar motor switch protein [Henriciella marina]|uniref:FliM/FliN family flagellar motor switch protein n=1 Tax=Henriciella marina TaxID=453851 RepID=UPI0003626B41|nr:FliM/FliN family flagellar motor C-terminal domain-containing protein [Henriciella marina]
MRAQIGARAQVTNSEVETRIREKFGYFCLPAGTGGLHAISIAPVLAERFVARRLKEDLSHVEIAPPLFLRLMCDKPVRRLMEDLARAIPAGLPLPEDFMVADPAGLADGISEGVKLITITVNFMSRGAVEPTGHLHLYYDVEALTAHAERIEIARTQSAKPRPAINKTRLIKSIRRSNISLDAVLARLPISVADCSRFEVGQLVPLTDAENGKLTLCAETMTGSVEIAEAELGNWKGRRAIKLTSPLLESFVQELTGA